MWAASAGGAWGLKMRLVALAVCGAAGMHACASSTSTSSLRTTITINTNSCADRTLQKLRAQHVIIEGATPAGLFLAERLLNNTPYVSVDIVDSRTGGAATSGGGTSTQCPVVVTESSKELLEDLLPFVERSLCWPSSVVRVTGSLDDMVETAPTARGGVIVYPSTLSDALLAHLKHRYPHRLRVLLRTECLSVDLQTKTAYLRDLRSGQLSSQEYSLIVGADGARSAVRAAICATELVTAQQGFYPDACKCISVTMPHVFATAGEANIDYRTCTGLFKLHSRQQEHSVIEGAWWPQPSRTSGEVRVCVSVMWTPSCARELEHPPGLDSQVTVQKFLRGILGHAPANELKVVQEFLQTHPHHSRWSFVSAYHSAEGAAALVGDAAHSSHASLVGGQALSAALEDATALEAALRKYNWCVARALQTYNTRRIDAGHLLTELSLLLYLPRFAFWERLLKYLGVAALSDELAQPIQAHVHTHAHLHDESHPCHPTNHSSRLRGVRRRYRTAVHRAQLEVQRRCEARDPVQQELSERLSC